MFVRASKMESKGFREVREMPLHLKVIRSCLMKTT